MQYDTAISRRKQDSCAYSKLVSVDVWGRTGRMQLCVLTELQESQAEVVEAYTASNTSCLASSSVRLCVGAADTHAILPGSSLPTVCKLGNGRENRTLNLWHCKNRATYPALVQAAVQRQYHRGFLDPCASVSSQCA